MSSIDIKQLTTSTSDPINLPHGSVNMIVTAKPFYKQSGPGTVTQDTTISSSEHALSFNEVVIAPGVEVVIESEWIIL